MAELMQNRSSFYNVSKFHYNSFGKLLKTTGAYEHFTNIDKEKDKESGLGDHGVRMYDPLTG